MYFNVGKNIKDQKQCIFSEEKQCKLALRGKILAKTVYFNEGKNLKA